MTQDDFKAFICEIGRRLYNRGFAAANDGNITVRLNDREILCTPTMVSKGFMKPEDICKVDYDGKQLAGTKPTNQRSAASLVRLQDRARRECRRTLPSAACHRVCRRTRADSPSACCQRSRFSLARCRLRPYATPGGQKFADTILPYVKECNTILLANHGTVTWGPTSKKPTSTPRSSTPIAEF